MPTMGELTMGSLFSGIGGLDLGLERGLGAATVWQVEQSSYCRSVLKRHWPNAQRFDDVFTVGSENLSRVQVVCGGFPCQPASVAGKRLGTKDPRWLWPQYARIIREIQPAVVVGENVPGLRTSGLRDVLSDLADLGFDAEWDHIRAVDLGAPHIRRRIFIVATHPLRVNVWEQPGWLGRAFRSAEAPVVGHHPGDDSDAVRIGRQAPRQPTVGPTDRRVRAPYPDSLRRLQQAWLVAHERGWPDHDGWRFDSTPRVDDVPTKGLVGAMRRAAGNAVVTACAFVVGRAVRNAVRFN